MIPQPQPQPTAPRPISALTATHRLLGVRQADILAAWVAHQADAARNPIDDPRTPDESALSLHAMLSLLRTKPHDLRPNLAGD